MFFSKENRSLHMSSIVTMLAGGTNDLEIFAGTNSMIYTQKSEQRFYGLSLYAKM